MFPPKHKQNPLAHQDSVNDLGPEVVEERTLFLDTWLRTITAALQFRESVLVGFLLPEYVAHRWLSGDIGTADVQELRTPPRQMLLLDSVESAMAIRKGAADPTSTCDARSPKSHAEGCAAEELASCRPVYSHVLHQLASSMAALSRSRLWKCPSDASVMAALSTESDRHFPFPDQTVRFVHCICSHTALKTSTVLAAAVYLDRLSHSMHSLLVGDGISWELALLAVLVLAAKNFESDSPIYASDFVGAANKWPALSRVRPHIINVAERRVLRYLDYRTVVSRDEFMRYTCRGQSEQNACDAIAVSAAA